MDLTEFGAGLRSVVRDDVSQRPFVCDGSPLGCQAFIVGSNAATEVLFWPFWSDDRGFYRAAWERAYLDAGRRKGRNGPSNTRRRIEMVAANAAPVRCLETNVYARPSRSTADLDHSQRTTEVLGYLLTAIKPKVVLAYGVHAQSAMARLTSDSKIRPRSLTNGILPTSAMNERLSSDVRSNGSQRSEYRLVAATDWIEKATLSQDWEASADPSRLPASQPRAACRAEPCGDQIPRASRPGS